MGRMSGGSGGHKSSGGGNRKMRGATQARKRRGEKGMSAYQAKQNKPYSQTMPGPKQRIRHAFDGFRRVSEYAVAAEPQAPKNQNARKW